MQDKLTKILNKGLKQRANARGDKPFFHVERDEIGVIYFKGTSVTGECVSYYVDDFFDVDQLVSDIDYIRLTCTAEDRVHMWLDAKEDDVHNVPNLDTLVKSAKDIYFHLSLLADDIEDMSFHELTIFDKKHPDAWDDSDDVSEIDADMSNTMFFVQQLNRWLEHQAYKRGDDFAFHAQQENPDTIAFVGTSVAGEELHFSVDYSDDINCFIDNVQELYEHFSVDIHVTNLLDEQNLGKSYSLGVSALVNDARRIEKSLKTLAEDITKISL